MLKSLTKLPKRPGVYLFRNKDKQVIYVGKAINLKSRVGSYFRKSADLAADKKLMVEEIKKIDYIIVDNELEAIYLESNLIKKYHPKYNIILRDDKFFVYIKIPKEEYPRVLLTRRIAKDKAKYFGPYLSAKQAKRMIITLRKIFPHRTCNIMPKSVCLEYHLGHCNAPCIKAVTKTEYDEVIQNIIRFLKGQYLPVQKRLQNEMEQYSAKQQYEKAARLRNQINNLQQFIERQKIISAKQEDQDIISLTKEKDWGVINLLQVRQGKLIDSKNFILDHLKSAQESEVIISFLKQYYKKFTVHPKQIIIAHKIEQSEISKLTHAKIVVTQKGTKKKLIALSQQNAQEWLWKEDAFIKKREQMAKKALAELSAKLRIGSLRRIEAYDVANIQGKNAVGSMIVFRQGLPDKSQYRKFAIKTFDSANDPGMIKEVIQRRLSNRHKWAKPDLILVDGGKPQLSAALSALKTTKHKIPVIALAKKMEEIFLPGQKQSIRLKNDSSALYLVQRIRDEAHRFATGFYQTKHSQKIKQSALAGIPGLGPVKKKLLKKELGSLAKIKSASYQQLSVIVGDKLAKKIKAHLLG